MLCLITLRCAVGGSVREYFGEGYYQDGVRRWSFRGYDQTPEAQFDDSGATAAAGRYSAYGDRISSVGTNMNREAFQGLRFDEEANHYNLGVREMDPDVGQWRSPEPLVISGKPILCSPYRYAANAPTVLTDPTGFDPVDIRLREDRKYETVEIFGYPVPVVNGVLAIYYQQEKTAAGNNQSGLGALGVTYCSDGRISMSIFTSDPYLRQCIGGHESNHAKSFQKIYGASVCNKNRSEPLTPYIPQFVYYGNSLYRVAEGSEVYNYLVLRWKLYHAEDEILANKYSLLCYQQQLKTPNLDPREAALLQKNISVMPDIILHYEKIAQEAREALKKYSEPPIPSPDQKVPENMVR